MVVEHEEPALIAKGYLSARRETRMKLGTPEERLP